MSSNSVMSEKLRRLNKDSILFHLMKCLVLAILVTILHWPGALIAQQLTLPKRKSTAKSGSEFAASIASNSISLQNREDLIYKEIVEGNVPKFLRKFYHLTKVDTLNGKIYKISVKVLPDYMAIGNDYDYFYVPMSPVLAQKVADLISCSLPTRLIVNMIYRKADIKLDPKPLAPGPEMTQVNYFLKHNELVRNDLKTFVLKPGKHLIAGSKKDIIISPKIYTETTRKVVIYGWHKRDGSPIQPLYNKHSNNWVDYSHGSRYVYNTIKVNGKKMSLASVLKDADLCALLSDEGIIEQAFYPSSY